MAQDSPIAVYRERLARVSRVLELYSDRVEVDARWRISGKKYHMTIRLGDLTAQPKRISVRQKMFKTALGMASLSAAAAVVFTRPGYQLPIWVIYVFYALAVFMGGVTMMTWPKVPFARFTNREGRPALDIAQAGPDAGNFEDFIAQVQKRIRKQ